MRRTLRSSVYDGSGIKRMGLGDKQDIERLFAPESAACHNGELPVGHASLDWLPHHPLQQSDVGVGKHDGAWALFKAREAASKAVGEIDRRFARIPLRVPNPPPSATTQGGRQGAPRGPQPIAFLAVDDVCVLVSGKGAKKVHRGSKPGRSLPIVRRQNWGAS